MKKFISIILILTVLFLAVVPVHAVGITLTGSMLLLATCVALGYVSADYLTDTSFATAIFNKLDSSVQDYFNTSALSVPATGSIAFTPAFSAIRAIAGLFTTSDSTYVPTEIVDDVVTPDRVDLTVSTVAPPATHFPTSGVFNYTNMPTWDSSVGAFHCVNPFARVLETGEWNLDVYVNPDYHFTFWSTPAYFALSWYSYLGSNPGGYLNSTNTVSDSYSISKSSFFNDVNFDTSICHKIAHSDLWVYPVISTFDNSGTYYVSYRFYFGDSNGALTPGTNIASPATSSQFYDWQREYLQFPYVGGGFKPSVYTDYVSGTATQPITAVFNPSYLPSGVLGLDNTVISQPISGSYSLDIPNPGDYTSEEEWHDVVINLGASGLRSYSYSPTGDIIPNTGAIEGSLSDSWPTDLSGEFTTEAEGSGANEGGFFNIPILGKIFKAIKALWDLLKNAFNQVIAWLSTLLNSLLGFFADVRAFFDDFGNFARNLLDLLRGSDLTRFISSIFGFLSGYTLYQGLFSAYLPQCIAVVLWAGWLVIMAFWILRLVLNR